MKAIAQDLLSALRNKNADLSKWFREDWGVSELKRMIPVDSLQETPVGSRHIGNVYENGQKSGLIWIDKEGNYYYYAI